MDSENPVASGLISARRARLVFMLIELFGVISYIHSLAGGVSVLIPAKSSAEIAQNISNLKEETPCMVLAASKNPIVKSESLTSVTYVANSLVATFADNAQLAYTDNAAPAPKSFTKDRSLPVVAARTNVPAVTGQWDFNGNLKATVGKDLEYFDGPDGETAATVRFNTCSNFGIPLINGVNANVMYLPGFDDGTRILAHYGFIMFPGIAPNGGGSKVNQYTIIYDMYYDGGTVPFFQCENTNMPYGTDGSLFLAGGNMGQGEGGYGMDNGPVAMGWHRLAFSVDLSQHLVTKWVDGVKAQDWVSPENSLDAPRRAWQAAVLLFADDDGPNNSGDDHTASIYVKSIQVRSGKLTDSQMMALGGPADRGVPLTVPTSDGPTK